MERRSDLWDLKEQGWGCVEEDEGSQEEEEGRQDWEDEKEQEEEEEEVVLGGKGLGGGTGRGAHTLRSIDVTKAGSEGEGDEGHCDVPWIKSVWKSAKRSDKRCLNKQERSSTEEEAEHEQEEEEMKTEGVLGGSHRRWPVDFVVAQFIPNTPIRSPAWSRFNHERPEDEHSWDIMASCRFIRQAESFSRQCTSYFLHQRPTRFFRAVVAWTSCMQWSGAVSHFQTLLQVRCGQDSFVACRFTSQHGAQAETRLSWARSIVAQIHRRHRRRMLQTLFAMKTEIFCDGYSYKTLNEDDPRSQELIRNFNKMCPVLPPWELCPNTGDARNVCARYPWAVNSLVLADGSAYCTGNVASSILWQKDAGRFPFSPGDQIAVRGCLKQAEGQYGVKPIGNDNPGLGGCDCMCSAHWGCCTGKYHYWNLELTSQHSPFLPHFRLQLHAHGLQALARVVHKQTQTLTDCRYVVCMPPLRCM